MCLYPLVLIHPGLQPARPPSARPTLTGRKACVRLYAISDMSIHITPAVNPVLFVMGTNFLHAYRAFLTKVNQSGIYATKSIKIGLTDVIGLGVDQWKEKLFSKRINAYFTIHRELITRGQPVVEGPRDAPCKLKSPTSSSWHICPNWSLLSVYASPCLWNQLPSSS